MASRSDPMQPILGTGNNTDFADFDYGAAALRIAPMRASYAPTSSKQGKGLARTEGGVGGGVRRAKSMPALTSDRLRHVIPMSPLFYRRYYISKAGTMTSSAFNLVSATLGTGVLALPSAMNHSGVLVGTLVLIFICICTVYSVYLLVRVSELIELNTYEELAEALLGSAAEKLTALILVAFCWGVGVVFVVVMGDFVSPLVQRVGLEHYVGRKSGMFVFWLAFMFPLSLAREINSLRFSSFISGASTLLLAVAVTILVVKAQRKGREPLRHVPLVRFDGDALNALSTFLFSYGCAPVVYRIRSEWKDGTASKMTLCATYSMAACTLIYIVTGVCGAMAYGSATQPNILSNLGTHLDVVYVQLAYFGMAVTVIMVFPMTIFPTRDSVVLAMGFRQEDNPCPVWLSSSVAGLLSVLALIFGMLVPNMRVLFDLLGGVAGGTLSFLLPGLFALRSGTWSVAEVGLGHVIGAWTLTVVGAVMCVLGTYCSVRSNFF